MSFSLHVSRETDLQVVEALEALTAHQDRVPPLVCLLRDQTDQFYLMATDGLVVRTHRLAVFWCRSSLDAHHDNQGPAQGYQHLPVWLDHDGTEPLPDLTRSPLKLQRRADRCSWDLVPLVGDPLETFGEPHVSAILRGHLRPAPTSFRSWFVAMSPAAMASFAASFAPGQEPPVLFIPEPQATAQATTPWAKYWAYHAKSLDPLGVVMGVKCPETVKHFSPQK